MEFRKEGRKEGWKAGKKEREEGRAMSESDPGDKREAEGRKRWEVEDGGGGGRMGRHRAARTTGKEYRPSVCLVGRVRAGQKTLFSLFCSLVLLCHVGSLLSLVARVRVPPPITLPLPPPSFVLLSLFSGN